MKNYQFSTRVRKEKDYSDVAYLNVNQMPFYNSAMIELYAYEETDFQPGFKTPFYPMVYWALEYVCSGEYHVSSSPSVSCISDPIIGILSIRVFFGTSSPMSEQRS